MQLYFYNYANNHYVDDRHTTDMLTYKLDIFDPLDFDKS